MGVASARLTLRVAVCLSTVAASHAADTITGQIVDGQGDPVAAATVIVFDHATGLPIDSATSRPFTKTGAPLNIQGFVHVTSGEDGCFEVAGLAPGKYRLVAQKWLGTVEPADELLAVRGRTVAVHGCVDGVDLPPSAAVTHILRPLGTGALHIDQKAPNDETLLLVSTQPPCADPALGFWSWGPDFLRGVLAFNRMPNGETTMCGLPAGKVYVAMFASDSKPGFALAEATIRPGRTTELHTTFVADWSDARHEPPEHLRPLFERVLAGEFVVGEVLGDVSPGALDLRRLGQIIARVGPLHREVDLPGGGKATVADLLAVERYVGLSRRAVRQQASHTIAGTANENEAVVRDLWQTVGRSYPCFELKHIDWPAVGEEFLPRAREAESVGELGLLCMELLARLEDSHAQLLAGQVTLPVPPLPIWDAGLACLVADGGDPAVYYLVPDGPAAKAGLQVGMTIERINGQPAASAIDDTMSLLSRYYGYSSRRYLRYDAHRLFARQLEQGAALSLDARDADGNSHHYALSATLRAAYLPRLPVPVPGIDENRNVSWKLLTGNIGHIYVRRIREDLTASLDRAVADLAAADGLIIDVRGNSGGGFDAREAFKNFAAERDSDEPHHPRFDGPLALLIDARCISAGEGWASWFVAGKRARLFGETTAGASARKTVYELKNKAFKARFPIKAYRGFLDRPIERRGLEPDVPLMQRAQDLAEQRDTVLEAARAYLLSLGGE